MKEMLNGLVLFIYIILSLAVFFNWAHDSYTYLMVSMWLILTYYLGSKLSKGKSW